MQNENDSTDRTRLRRLAEKALQEGSDEKYDLSEKSPEDMASLIHQLRVHQIELQMQNEELHRIQVELEMSRDRYVHLYDFAPIAYFTVNEKGIITAANMTAAALLGRERTYLVGRMLSHFVQREDQDIWYLHRKRLLETGDFQSFQLRLIKNGGAEFYVNIEGMLVKDSDNKYSQIRIAVADITARKRAEETLRRSQDRYRSFIELTGQLGWTTNANGEVVEDIPTWREFTGQSLDEIMGWGWSKALHPDDFEAVSRAWSKAVAEKKKYEAEYRVRRHDGEYRSFLVYGVPVFEEDGNVYEWVGTCIDISERIEMEKVLRRSNEELEILVQNRTAELNQRAEQLARLTLELSLAEHQERRRIAEILHDDLQQLLVGAKINQELMIHNMDNALKPEAERVLELIKQSLREMRSLSAELSPSILRSGDFTASLQWLAKWMYKNQDFELTVKSGKQIMIDRQDFITLLYQSIRELLLNVVKHAGVNSAEVEMVNRNGNLLITVRDEGHGFNPEAIWSEKDPEQKFGLITIRERLMHLGGHMEIESMQNAGSTISLIVPLNEKISAQRELSDLSHETSVKPVTVPAAPNGIGLKIRVMLVDDHPVMREGLSRMLNSISDIEVVGEASDGEMAINLCGKMVPDVILMDISMPNMDGLEATRIIHSKLPHIRIIGLSMYDEDDQTNAMLAAGASAYRSKSGNMDRLLAAIRGED